MTAWRHGNGRFAMVLPRRGADPKATNGMGQSALHLPCRDEAAVYSGATEARYVGELIGIGLDPNARDRAGRTPMHHAVTHRGAGRLISELTGRGARWDIADDEGKTARQRMDEHENPGR